jgi:GNAT superfamily N-acetyltransferase
MTDLDHITLRDGTTMRARPIGPHDRDTLQRGVEALSPESRYKRFLSPAPRLSSSQLDYLVNVDHHDHEALVAMTEDGDPAGVGRWVRLKDEPTAAEVAVVVNDDWHGRGVGTGLLKALAARAREEGIDHFTATALAENHQIIDLLEELGPAHVTPIGSGLVEMRIELPTDCEDGTPLRSALRRAAKGQLTMRDEHER